MVAFLAGYRSSLSLQSQWQLAAFVHWADPRPALYYQPAVTGFDPGHR